MARNIAKGNSKPIFKMSKDEYAAIDSNRKIKEITGSKGYNKITGKSKYKSKNEGNFSDYVIKEDPRVGHDNNWEDVKMFLSTIHQCFKEVKCALKYDNLQNTYF